MTILDINNPAHPGHSNHVISTNGIKAQRVWNPEKPLNASTVKGLLMDWERKLTEQCGFIDSEEEFWYVSNIHQYPKTNFLMDNSMAQKTLDNIFNKLNRTVLGIFHTHPNNVPWPSPRDIVGWPNPKLKWRYFIVTSKDVLEWELVDD